MLQPVLVKGLVLWLSMTWDGLGISQRCFGEDSVVMVYQVMVYQNSEALNQTKLLIVNLVNLIEQKGILCDTLLPVSPG